MQRCVDTNYTWFGLVKVFLKPLKNFKNSLRWHVRETFQCTAVPYSI